MTACATCGGYGMHHDPIAHGTTPESCEHIWIEQGGPGDEWHECDLCGAKEDW